MAILKGADADAELAKVKAVEDLAAASTKYPLTGLSADDFEVLCYALFKNSAPDGLAKGWDDAAIVLRGADAGRDLLLHAQQRCGA